MYCQPRAFRQESRSGKMRILVQCILPLLVLAPLFVWMEVMFACGYRPGLRSDIDRRVKRAVEERERGGAKDD